MILSLHMPGLLNQFQFLLTGKFFYRSFSAKGSFTADGGFVIGKTYRQVAAGIFSTFSALMSSYTLLEMVRLAAVKTTVATYKKINADCALFTYFIIDKADILFHITKKSFPAGLQKNRTGCLWRKFLRSGSYPRSSVSSVLRRNSRSSLAQDGR